MPNAAVLAAALTDHSAHPYSLWVDGLDVIGLPAGTIGTARETIRLTEAGPGGVSSIEFTFRDDSGSVTIANGASILFWWNTPDVPLFRGWVDTYSVMPDSGGQARWITIQGIGIEALLDWLIIGELPGGAHVAGVFGQEISYLGGVAGVPNAIFAGAATQSSQAAPVGGYYRASGDNVNLSANWDASWVGYSLRRAISELFDWMARIDPQPVFAGASQPRVLFTMDFYGGLRLWNDDTGVTPTDYTNLTVNDVYAGAILAENLAYTVDPSQVVHEVYVKGSSAANSGWFSDGTGIRGKQALVSDTTNITSPDLAAQAAKSVFQANSNQVRGSFEITDFTPTATIHAGSFVTITDAAAGQSAAQYRIMQIDKAFTGSGRQDWKVTFGSLAPNVVNYTRRLTYTVRA